FGKGVDSTRWFCLWFCFSARTPFRDGRLDRLGAVGVEVFHRDAQHRSRSGRRGTRGQSDGPHGHGREQETTGVAPGKPVHGGGPPGAGAGLPPRSFSCPSLSPAARLFLGLCLHAFSTLASC